LTLISSNSGPLTLGLGVSITSQRMERIRRLCTKFDGMGHSNTPRRPSHTRRHQNELGEVADVSTCVYQHYDSHESFSTLEGIKNSIEDRQKTSPAKAFWNYIKDQDSINSMKKDLDMTLQQFQVRPFASIRHMHGRLFLPPAGIHDDRWTRRSKSS
jgi:hypothetical protein